MNEPLPPLPPDLDDLFARARDDRGGPERLARVASRLEPHLTPPRPPAPWPRWGRTGTALVVGASLVALGLGHVLTSSTRAPGSPVPGAAVVSAPVPPASGEPASVPAASGDGEPAPSGDSPPTSARPPAVAATVQAPAAPPSSDIVEEHHLLAEARRSLASSPARTLDLLGQHQRRFPRGVLVVEREFLRVSALFQLGRGAEGRAAAESFVKRFPGSPYRAEVERRLGR
jgi:hypothetical protein